jgi:hypothetical protein
MRRELRAMWIMAWEMFNQHPFDAELDVTSYNG